jgi:vacuolar-type H+-ATPase subunit H
VDRPLIPAAPPGQSALPLFRSWEAELSRRIEEAGESAKRRIEDSRAQAARIRSEGEERLKHWVLEAQDQALREAEDRARDRISDVRARTQRWVETAEEAARSAVDDALDLCCES